MADVIAVCGSYRTGSLNRKLLRLAVRELEALQLSVEVLDLKTLALPVYDGDVEDASGLPQAALDAKAKITAAKGLLIVSPEYNGSIPGGLKNFIDWCSRGEGNPFDGKVISVNNASTGAYGGARSTIAIKASLTHLNAWVVPGAMNLPKADGAFDDQGELKEAWMKKGLARAMATFAKGLAKLALLVCFFAACAEPVAVAPPVLPLKKVHIYENGLAYFERAGDASDGISLPVTKGRLDDVLKSLVVLQGVRKVDFTTNISQSRARAIAGLPDGAKQPLGFCALARSLKGSRVQIFTTDGSARGRLVEVLPACDEDKARTLLLLGEDGGLRRFGEEEIEILEPLDQTTKQELDRAAAALSTRRAETTEALQLRTKAGGPVAVGYVSEAPLWRASYRMITGGKDGAHLQAWALVHNDSADAWHDVEVSLVSGKPDGFLFPLSAPRYVHREVRAPDAYLPSIPQLARQSADDLWDEEEAADGVGAGGGYGYADLGGRGRGEASGGLVTGERAVTSSDVLQIGALSPDETAQGAENGALFSFRLADKVSLEPQSSTLVPLLDQGVSTREIAWLGGDETALAGLVMKNDTAYVLPAGPLAWYRDGSFSGEATFNRLEPKKRRLLLLGEDVAVKGKRKTLHQGSELRALTYDPRARSLVEHRVNIKDIGVSIDNRAASERVVYVSMGKLVENGKVEGADEIDFEPDTKEVLAVVKVPARNEAQRRLHVEEAVASSFTLDRTVLLRLSDVATSPSLVAANAAIVRDAAAVVTKDKDAFEKAQKLDNEARQIEQDIARLKEHLKAVEKADGDAAGPLVQRLAATEDKLAAMKRQQSAANDQLAKTFDAVSTILARLPLATQ